MKCYIPIAGIDAYCFSYLPDLIDSRMYLMRSLDQVICIDPCINEDAETLLSSWHIEKCTVILTHEHYDHVSGVNRLREVCHCHVICNESCGRLIQDSRTNLSQYAESLYIDYPEAIRNEATAKSRPFSCTADETFSGIKEYAFSNHIIKLIQTPGHSAGSICICLDDLVVFTGDSLIPHKPVVTRLPGGSQKEFYRSTLPFLNSLPKGTYILPGHFDGGWLNDLI